MGVISDIWSGFVSMLYPDYCAGCKNDLVRQEEYICTRCRYKISQSEQGEGLNTLLAKKFWGKVPVEHSMAFLKYNRKGIVSNILWKIKYKSGEDLGRYMGEWYGHTIRQQYKDVFDLIVPVPLHPAKLKLRGYNQSEAFADGLSKSLGIKYEDILERVIETSTQTKKKRYERWENVNYAFSIKKDVKILATHILLVDDVITTGATTQACIEALLKAGYNRISVATIAAA